MVNYNKIKVISLCIIIGFLIGIIISITFISLVDADYRTIRGSGSISASGDGCSPPIDWANSRNCVLKKTCDTCMNSYSCDAINTSQSSYFNIVTNCDGNVISSQENKPMESIVPGMSNFSLFFFGTISFFFVWILTRARRFF